MRPWLRCAVSRLCGVVDKLERHEDEVGDVPALALRLLPPSSALAILSPISCDGHASHPLSRFTRQALLWCLGARLTCCSLSTIDFLHVLHFVPLLSFISLLRHLFLGLVSADISSSPLRLRNSISPAFDDQRIAITSHSHWPRWPPKSSLLRTRRRALYPLLLPPQSRLHVVQMYVPVIHFEAAC